LQAGVTGLVILCAAVSLTVVAGLVLQQRSGALRATPPDDSLRPVLAELGAAPGERATLLQFSSAFCAPCRATRRILTEVSAMVDGVVHVEVDAEQHLALVRRLHVLKTPTTLVLDGEQREVQRASGQPRKADVLAALGKALP
jgi:thiol-disulfide isomerase/thioredoxin